MDLAERSGSETLRLLVSDDVLHLQARRLRSEVPSREDTDNRIAAGRSEWSYKFDRQQLDSTQLTRAVWLWERQRRVNRQTSASSRATTLDELEVARAVGPRFSRLATATLSDSRDSRLTPHRLLICPCCRDPLVMPCFRGCGHAFCSPCMHGEHGPAAAGMRRLWRRAGDRRRLL